MRKKISKNIFAYCLNGNKCVSLPEKFKFMAKKTILGRPKGPKKVPLNVYVTVERKKKAKAKARELKWGVSTLIETALEKAYGI